MEADAAPSNILGLPFPVVAVDYYDGLRAFEAGLPEIAFTLWIQAALLGDTRAMLEVAKAFESGEILPQDQFAAAYFYSLASRYFPEARARLNILESSLSGEDIAAIEAAVSSFVPFDLTTRMALELSGPADLFEAAAAGDAVRVRALLDEGVDATTASANGWTAIMYASLAGSAEAIAALAGAGADLHAVNSAGFTALHIAAFEGQAAAVEELIRQGAFAAITTPERLLPSDLADYIGQSDLVAMLQAREVQEISQLEVKLVGLGYKEDAVQGQLTNAFFTALGMFENALRITAEGSCVQRCLITTEPTGKLSANLIEQLLNATPGPWHVIFDDPVRGALLYQYCCDEQEAIAAVDRMCGEAGCEMFLVPLGACVSAAKQGSSVMVSSIHPTTHAADAHALERCDSECSIEWHFCAGTM